MAKVENLERVVKWLRDKAAKSAKTDNVSVVVGYTANYAIYVHENLEAVHGQAYNEKYANEIASGVEHSRGINQQAKFLEAPARTLKSELAEIVRLAVKKGKTLAQGLLLAGLRLLRESQKIVPVDTGNLKASGFVRLDKGGDGTETHEE